MREALEAHRVSPTCAVVPQDLRADGAGARELRRRRAAGARSTRGSRSTPRARARRHARSSGVVDLRKSLGTATRRSSSQVVAQMLYLCDRARHRAPGHADGARDRRDAAARSYKFSSLVLSIVKSDMFRMNQKAATGADGAQGVSIGHVAAGLQTWGNPPKGIPCSDQEAHLEANGVAGRGRRAAHPRRRTAPT